MSPVSSQPLEALLAECRKVIVGQPTLLNRLLVAMLCRGHVLLEGLPGLAKTRTIKTLAQATGMSFKRIQFTPDLLPSDVVGTLIFDPKALTFTPKKGPIFANLVLADEINRAPSKVQAALLEAMEERQVTLGDESFRLPNPFLVLATQNPLEQEGTFPLPEAQMDRFLFKLHVDYPKETEEVEVLRRANARDEIVNPVLEGAALEAASRSLDQIRLDDAIRAFIVKLVQATRPGHGKAWKGKELVRCGASPRASLALQSSSKAFALLAGRDHVLPQDIVELAPDILRHRLLLTYEAEADGVRTDEVVKQLIQAVPRP
ncbi:MAG: MoxR family ATPase [Acidobacteria bacterium]|nr:MoxR family ATPase [Acidobacteriota bacterium]